ncbi:MAG: hypothetical protein KA444_10760 [Bacteroidia bacterium]|nr:hypothetical protein [Bacteroidia bacterium]
MKKLYTFALLSIAFLMVSCSRESDESTALSNEALVSLIKQTEATDVDAAVSRINAQNFRLRMNSIAKNSLAGHGDMAVSYAMNSMLVKEYLNNDGEVTGYDVMYHSPADPNSSDGWLWASYDANGDPTYDVNLRGANCNSCHGKENTLVLGNK